MKKVKRFFFIPAVAGGLAQNSIFKCNGKPGNADGVLLRAVTVGKPIKMRKVMTKIFLLFIIQFDSLPLTPTITELSTSSFFLLLELCPTHL